jgi:DNA-binding CsgD family transcriptional regulator
MTERTLLEREGETAALSDALTAAGEGSGSVLMVQGPAGIGKTSLVEIAARIAEREGIRVLAGRGGALEGEFSFGVVRQLLERPVIEAAAEGGDILVQAAALAAPVLNPRAEGGSPQGPLDPQAALHGLFWVCSNLSEEAPLLLSVDDAHWADPESLRFLLYLSRRIRDLPALLLIGRRPEEGETEPGVFAELLLERSVDQLELGPLSLEAVAAMVGREYGADPDPAFSEACHRATAGNPFFLLELLAALREDGIAPTAVAAGRIGTLTPEAVRLSVAARLGRLPAVANRLARAVAVLETDAGLQRAGALSGLDDAETADAAGELLRAGLLTESEPVTFAHPIVRESVYAEIASPERSNLHVRAAKLLQAEGAEPDALAPHLLAVEPAGDEKVVEVLRAAAGSALARGAPEIAAMLLGRALREPPPPELQRELTFDLGRAELMAGLPECADRLREALELSDAPAQRAEVARAISGAALQGGDPSAGIPVLAEVIAEIGDSDAELRLTLEGDRVTAGMLGVQEEHARLMTELEPLASGLAGESLAECTLLSALAYARAASVGSTASAAIEAGRLGATGASFADLSFDTSSLSFAIIAFTDCDAWEPAEREIGAARDRCQAAGSLSGFGLHSDLMGNLRVRRGDLLRAEAEATNALDAARLLGIQTGTHSTVAVLLDVMAERGQIAEGTSLIEEFELRGELPPIITFHWLQESRARLWLAAGDHRRALDDLLELGRRSEDWNITNPARTRWRSMAALAHLEVGDADEAERLASEELELAERFGASRGIGIALRARGMVLGGEAGIADLRRAVEVLGESGAELELARAEVELGAALRRAGKRTEARERLAAGLDGASRCAATTLVERAREELHAAGARPRRERLSGVESLTARERSVAELAADGLSNREIARALFVTLKTVEKHLGNVFMKLDIKSRKALPDALAGPGSAKK